MSILGPLSSPASRFLPFRSAPLPALDLRRRSWRPRRVLDPGGDVVLLWNRVFLVFCMLGLFTDPLHFFIIYVGGNGCLKLDTNIAIIATVVRTLADLSYVAHMVLKFRTAFVAPSSRVFGRGELVTDPRQIAIRYLQRGFAMDFVAMLPIPQARTHLSSLLPLTPTPPLI